MTIHRRYALTHPINFALYRGCLYRACSIRGVNGVVWPVGVSAGDADSVTIEMESEHVDTVDRIMEPVGAPEGEENATSAAN